MNLHAFTELSAERASHHQPGLLLHDASEDVFTDICHPLCSRWHYEMANLNMLTRAIVRVMYGTTLKPGTHHEALLCFVHATDLNPGRLIHHVEAGRLYRHLGQPAKAVEELEVRKRVRSKSVWQK